MIGHDGVEHHIGHPKYSMSGCQFVWKTIVEMNTVQHYCHIREHTGVFESVGNVEHHFCACMAKKLEAKR